MIRDITALANNKFDLLIIGGGIHGAALFCQAASAGLSVALIEKADFGHATSANSQKIIHGGIRYLQQFDIGRIRQSLRERQRLMLMAPHLVHPLPCIMPIYGHGLRGIEAMSLGLKLFDLIGKNRNKISDPSKFIPDGRILSISEIRELIPNLNPAGLKGGAKWYDSYCYNTERLVLAFIKTAYRLGGVAYNYVKAKNILPKKYSNIIIKAHDKINDEYFDICAKNVINCSGPWIYNLLNSWSNESIRNQKKYAAGINIITKKLFSHDMAVGLKNYNDRKSQLYFITPWRGKSIIGTEWFSNDKHPSQLMADERQCLKLINALNAAYLPANLSLDDVYHVHVGLVPCENSVTDARKKINLLNHFMIIDHRKKGLDRVISAVGVKYTTAAHVAEKTLKYLFPRINTPYVSSQSQLIGGEIEDFSSFKTEMLRRGKSNNIEEEDLLPLLYNYGSETDKIIELTPANDQTNSEFTHPYNNILKAEVLFAVREEMAQKLTDVILRRTELGTAGCPTESSLKEASILMAAELDWDEIRRKTEIIEVKDSYPPFLSLKNLEIQKESERISNFQN